MKPTLKNIAGMDTLCLENIDPETAVVFFSWLWRQHAGSFSFVGTLGQRNI